MIEERLEKRRVNLIIIACFALYVSSMTMKSIFTAELVTILEVFGAKKSEASLANTFYYTTYCILQLVLTPLMPKIDYKKYLLITVPFSIVICFLEAFAENIYYFWIYYALNGIFQAGIWACTMKIIGKYIPRKHIPKANTCMSVGFAVGFSLSYIISSLCIWINHWELAFIIVGVIFLASFVLFIYVVKNYCDSENSETELVKEIKNEVGFINIQTKKQSVIYIVLFCILSFFGSALYYSINNWVAPFIKDVYGLSNSVSVLITTLLPICMAIPPFLIIRFCRTHKDFPTMMFIFYIVVFAISITLVFVYNLSIYLALPLIILALSFQRFDGVVRGNIIPLNMRNTVDTGSFSASTNALASLAAGVFPTICGAIIENYGYGANYVFVSLLTVCALITIGVGFILMGKLKRAQGAKN